MNFTYEELIKINKGFLYQLALKYSKNSYIYGISFDDLYQVGCLALIEKYPEYDSSKGMFSTFSYWVIKGAMLNYIRNNCTTTNISNNIYALSRKYMAENNLFYSKNGRYMTLEEQVKLLSGWNTQFHTNVEKLAKTLNVICSYHYKDMELSLYDRSDNDMFEIDNDDYYELDEMVTTYDCVDDNVDIENEVINNISMEQFINSLTYLTDKDKDIFLETLGLIDDIPKTRKQLAEKYNITLQSIDRKYKKSLHKVRLKEKKNLI